jgi:tetratricopeptide (TPR) repeat protein
VSLLLKALQRASRSREASVAGAGRGAGRAGDVGRATSREADVAARALTTSLFARAGTAPDLSEAASAAAVDAAALRGGADGGGALEWVRDNPVYGFAIAVLAFLVLYFAYVYVAINHPGLLTGGSSRSQVLPAPATRPIERSPVTADASAGDIGVGSAAPPPPMPALGLPSRGEAGEAAQSQLTMAPPLATLPPVRSGPAGEFPPLPAAGATTPATTPRETARPVTAAPSRAEAAPAPTPRRTRAQTGMEDQVSVQTSDASGVVALRLSEGYDSLQRGEVSRALALYQSVLERDRRNVDALLGIASAHWSNGDSEKASEHYYRVLELEPQNAAAQAGLINMVGQADPLASETRLKQLIAREPSGFLYSALGNLHAEQKQWSAAQQAYFQAFQMEPSNPDYAFNLAVGLEHLGQRGIAAGYYRQALDLARVRGHATFDQARVAGRLATLEAAGR